MCLPVLHQSFCSHITLYQQTDISFTPVDAFVHQFYPLTQQAKDPVRLHRDVDGEKDLVQLCYTRQNILLMGHDATDTLCVPFILAISYVLKKGFSAVSLSSHPEFRLIVIIT